LDAPAVVLLGDASACNLFSSGRSLANAVPRLLRAVKIAGASHCDFESPTNLFCTAMCGASSRDKQLEAQNATVLAALELLVISHAAHAGEASVPAEGSEPVPAAVVAPPPDTGADR
ncbi:MAG: hypothetical protein ABI585_04075, partial [Betaproteobacteria bacterium]